MLVALDRRELELTVQGLGFRVQPYGIMGIIGRYRECIGIMEKKTETTIGFRF